MTDGACNPPLQKPAPKSPLALFVAFPATQLVSQYLSANRRRHFKLLILSPQANLLKSLMDLSLESHNLYFSFRIPPERRQKEDGGK